MDELARGLGSREPRVAGDGGEHGWGNGDNHGRAAQHAVGS
jgi:hypothetical protein